MKETKLPRTAAFLVLDESGSMVGLQNKTISGVNEYIDSLKLHGNRVRFSLLEFNSLHTEFIEENTPVKDVKHLSNKNYKPDGTTPLYDAIARGIASAEKVEEEKDVRILFIVVTDGLENASHEYNRKKIFDLITEKQKSGKWTFVYLGANQDAWSEGEKIGYHYGNVMTYDANPQGFRIMYDRVKYATAAYLGGQGMSCSNFLQNTGDPPPEPEVITTDNISHPLGKSKKNKQV